MSVGKIIPQSEVHFIFARSGGAGGQNVNKTSTKVILHWWVGDSKIFSSEEKDLIRLKLKNRLNMDDEVVVVAEEERSQAQNRARAIEKLQEFVQEAIRIQKKRKSTRPTFSSKIKKIEHKKKRSAIKKSRRILED
jgi:ribosome-associated protein